MLQNSDSQMCIWFKIAISLVFWYVLRLMIIPRQVSFEQIPAGVCFSKTNSCQAATDTLLSFVIETKKGQGYVPRLVKQ